MRVFNQYDSGVIVKKKTDVALFSPVNYVSENLFEEVHVFDADLWKKSRGLPEHVSKSIL